MRDAAIRFLTATLGGAVLCTSLAAQTGIEVNGTGTQVKNWTEDGQTFSAVSRDGGATWTPLAAPKNYIDWRGHRIDPLAGDPRVPPQLEAGKSNELFYVQFVTDVIAEYHQELFRMGAEAVRYHPHESLIVRIDRDRLDDVRDLAFVRAVMELETAHKLDMPIQVGLAAGSLATKQYNIMLMDKNRDAASLEQRILDVGGTLDAPAGGGVVVSATLTQEQLEQISQENTVIFVDEYSAPEYDMDNARIQTGTDYVELMAGMDGVGIRGHVNEAIHDNHPEFAAIPGVRTDVLAWGTNSSSSHGTNTAGEIYAQGLPGGVKGVLPFAQMIESASVSTTRYQMVQDCQDPAQPYQTMIMTQSWGGSRTLDYTTTSALLDDILFDFDHLFATNSQSNAGGPMSRPEAWAKNVCGIGGFNHFNNADPSDDCWCNTGSTGPAQDGRVGVSFSAYYDNIRTTDLSNGYTNGFGGTSGATPIVNGLAGGAIQMLTDGHFGYPATSTPGNRFADRPNLTTTRVLLAIGTRQVLFTNSKRLEQGWGLPNLQDLYDNRDNLLLLDEEDVLQQGETRTYTVYVKPGTAQFRASMHHLEDEAVPSAIPTRINSLDLSVTELGTGTTWYGNDQNPMGILERPMSVAGGAPNDIDVHENVILFNPNAGVYEVSVNAQAVRADSHKETGAMDADFALAIRGIGGGRDKSGMELDMTSNFLGHFDVAVSNVPGGWTTGVTMFSKDVARFLSLGDTFGVERDGLATAILTSPVITGSVFHFDNTGGNYPHVNFTFPFNLAKANSGLTLDAVVILFDASGNVVAVSNADRVTLQ